MTFVVTEACIRCKYTDCVDVCPVGPFCEGPNFLVINPDECTAVHAGGAGHVERMTPSAPARYHIDSCQRFMEKRWRPI